MLKTSENVEKSDEEREDLAEEIRAVEACGDGDGDRVYVSSGVLADWARRVEECEWGSGVLMAPRGSDDVPLLLGDWVRRKGDTMDRRWYPKWFADAIARGVVYQKANPDYPVECTIRTLEGEMDANLGDYIIRGVNGELYPCKPDIFDKTYERCQ